jgi:hypothetical protein
MSASRNKFPPPILSRATTWSLERIVALQLPEIKQLLANAERLQEEDIAALCKQAIKVRPRTVAVKKPGAKPRAKPKPKAEVAA